MKSKKLCAISFPICFSSATGPLMSKEPVNEWKQHYWKLLMEKCRLAHVTLADEARKGGPSNAEKSLHHLRMAALIWAHLEPPGLPMPGSVPTPVAHDSVSLQTHALGLAGDVYFSMVQHWNEVASPAQIDYCQTDEQLQLVLKNLQGGVIPPDYFPYPSSLHEALQFSLEHYRLALTSFGPNGGVSASDFLSLAKRLGNVCNEMGVFFMSKASGKPYQTYIIY